MKQGFSRKAVFVIKSLLWSVMIYVGCMLAINWDEVNYAIRSRQSVSSIAHVITQPAGLPAIVGTDEPGKTNIAEHNSVLSVLKIVLVQAAHIISGK